MKKPAETNEEKTASDIQNIQARAYRVFIESVRRKIIVNNFRLPKIAISVFIAVAFLTSVIFSVIYYGRNLTPAAILDRSVGNLLESKNIDYNGVIKLIFSHADKEEKLDLGDLEIYSLLKRSVSDSHEIIVQGEHGWSSGFPEGKYDLTWSVSDKKVFGFEGYYSGYELFYKANPYAYSELVDDDLKKNYSEVDLEAFLHKVLSDEDLGTVSDARLEDFNFEVVQTFPDDLIEGSNSYHYKVKMSGTGRVEKLLENVNYDDLDVWIDRKSKKIKKVKGYVRLINIGMEGNNLDIQIELKSGI